MKKLNKQVAYDLFISKGYKVLSEYENSSTPILCEKNGYRYKISYSNLRSNKTPSLWSISNADNLKYNIENLLKQEKSHCCFLDYKIIVKNKRKRVLLLLQCECGKSFNKLLDDFVYDKHKCCHECAVKYRGKNQRNTKEVINFIERKGYIVIDKSQNYRKNDYVEVIDSMGFKGFVKYNYLKANKGMSRFDIRVNKKHYIENVNQWANLNNIGAICVGFSEKEYTRQGLKFKCECGNIFDTSISAFQTGKIRCSKCAKSISSYEKIFEDYLISQNISYIYQYSLNQCRDILPLPFDFYLKDYGIIIEIDGEGHFRPAHFNHISFEQATEAYEITIKHDNIKNEYCKQHNIPLLKISYTNIKDGTYKQTFQEFIKE